MSLRSRLLVSLLIVSAGATFLAGGVVYLEGRSSLTSQFDENLLGRLLRAAPIGSRVGSLPVGLCSAARQLQIIDDEGRVASACPGTRLPKATVSQIRRALVQGYSLKNVRLSGKDVRIALVPMSRRGQQATLLQAGEPLEELVGRRAAFTRSLFLIFGGVFILLAIAIFVAVQRSLGKVGQIASTTSAILRGERAGKIHDATDDDDELGALVRAVNDLFGQLDKVASSERGFVADAARELGRPLVEMRGRLATLLEGEPSVGELRASVAKARDQLGRLTRLVDALLLFVRLDSGLEHIPANKSADLGSLTETVVDELKGQFEARQIQVETDFSAGCLVAGSGELLQLAAESIIANAFEHGPDQGLVSVRVAVEGDEVALIVEDSGPGIPVDQRLRVFERFARGQGGGFGVGLSLARDVVLLHGGKIHLVDSKLGGARFEVRLPHFGAQTSG